MFGDRDRLRSEITEGVLGDILNPSNLEKLLGRLCRRDPNYCPDDSFSAIIKKVRNRYADTPVSDLHKLRSRIYKATDDIPKYNPLLAYGLYFTLTNIVGQAFFDRIKVTGSIDRVLDLAEKEPIVVLPPHFDMLDPAMYDYVFMKRGRRLFSRPLVWHMGANLKSTWIDSYLLQRANGFWIKRSHDDNIDRLVYSESVTGFIREGWAQGIFIEGTRQRDLKVAPLRRKKRSLMERDTVAEPIKTGAIASLLRANQNYNGEIWICEAVHNAPFFPDVLFDYQKELLEGKKKSGFSTLKKLLNIRFYDMVSPDSGIFIHFMEPYPLPSSTLRSMNSSQKRKRFAASVRKTFKENITVLPENLFAYTVRFIDLKVPEYQDLDPESRSRFLESTYLTMASHLNENETILKADILRNKPDEAFDIGHHFYSNICKRFDIPPVIDDDYSLKPNLLIETSSNRIQHYLKKFSLEKQEKKNSFNDFWNWMPKLRR